MLTRGRVQCQWVGAERTRQSQDEVFSSFGEAKLWMIRSQDANPAKPETTLNALRQLRRGTDSITLIHRAPGAPYPSADGLQGGAARRLKEGAMLIVMKPQATEDDIRRAALGV